MCGEGRLNALRSLGEETIPALVVEVSDEEAFVMSLVENIARRQYRPLEILSSIRQLFEKGYSPAAISTKTGLTPTYVSGILTLLKQGEERLLVAVEKGMVPLNTALDIVAAGENDTRTAIRDAGRLRSRDAAWQEAAADAPHHRAAAHPGRFHRPPRARRKSVDITKSSLVRVYEKEVERKKMTLKKADLTQKRLLFIVSALRQLLASENFVNLLRAERLDAMPKYLADRVWPDKVVR